MTEGNTAAARPMLRTEGLGRSFGHHRALDAVDLQVESGECLAVFGPNGAGKTTLIKVLATIMRPSSGRVMVAGLDLRDSADSIRRRIGVVTHQTFLYDRLTAYENLEFYSRLYDVPGHRERIRDLIDRVGMTARLHDRVDTLSRGMQQRVTLARSVLHDPDILLLDEPEAALDRQAVATLWELLRSEAGRRRTVLLVTHNLERGLELCDRLVILDGGRIVHRSSRVAASFEELREAYAKTTERSA